MSDTSQKPETRNIAYGILAMNNGEGLDIAEKQIKQAMEINPTEFYYDILHTPNQTPTALEWKPEIEAMIEALTQRPAIHAVVKLNVNPRHLRARLELDKKALLTRTNLHERRME